MAQPIEIRISNASTSSGSAAPTPNTPSNVNGASETTKRPVMKSVIASRLANAAIQQAKTCLTTYVANYGNSTGNYLAQERMENNISMAEQGINLAVSTAMGFAINPVIGAVNLGIQAVSTIVNVANQVNQYNINLAKQNANAQFNSANLGIILVGGSR